MRRITSRPVSPLFGEFVEVWRLNEAVMVGAVTHRAETPLVDEHKEDVTAFVTKAKSGCLIGKQQAAGPGKGVKEWDRCQGAKAVFQELSSIHSVATINIRNRSQKFFQKNHNVKIGNLRFCA